jgi:hypothetical protein
MARQIEFWDIQPDSEESSRGRIQKIPRLEKHYNPVKRKESVSSQLSMMVRTYVL